MSTPSRLSPTARAALQGAADHPDHRVELPPLPVAARNGVIRSMLRAGLVEEVQADGGSPPALRATAAGLEAVAGEPADAAVVPAEQAPEAPEAEPCDASSPTDADASLVGPEAPPGRVSVRAAAEALLIAWDAQQGVTEALVGLRAALAPGARAAVPGAPCQPRTDTKQAQVLALLRRHEGATIAQVMEVTGWAPHTVRGFLAGLKRKAISLDVVERVRQVGPNKPGAKGSYSVYRLATVEAG